MGSDPLGHAYVVPLAHVLKQVRWCFGIEPRPQLAVPSDIRSSSKSLGKQPLRFNQIDNEGVSTPANLVAAGASVLSLANTTDCETPTPRAPIPPDDAYDSAAECSSAEATEFSSEMATDSDISSGSEIDSSGSEADIDRETCKVSGTKDQQYKTPEALPIHTALEFGEMDGTVPAFFCLLLVNRVYTKLTRLRCPSVLEIPAWGGKPPTPYVFVGQ